MLKNRHLVTLVEICAFAPIYFEKLLQKYLIKSKKKYFGVNFDKFVDFCTYSNGQLRGIFGQDRNRVSISKRPTYETANIEYGQLRGIPVVVYK